MSRYVVLHHRLSSEQTTFHNCHDHFDWMFDQGDSLLTWATDELPSSLCESSRPAKQLPDHRRIYLAFEGELTGGRGTVTRVESGISTIRHSSQDHFEFEVSGDRTGVISFKRSTILRTAADDKRDVEETTWYWSFRPA